MLNFVDAELMSSDCSLLVFKVPNMSGLQSIYESLFDVLSQTSDKK